MPSHRFRPRAQRLRASAARVRDDSRALSDVAPRLAALRCHATGYRQNGLRTTGSWTGSGDSLDSISLATGLLVSSTENSTQDVDYKITSARSGSSLRRKGRVQSQLIITLVPDSH